MANIYLNAKKDLTTNTVTTVYTVPSNSRAIVKSLLVSSDNAIDTTITVDLFDCLLYTSPSPRDRQKSRMPSSA